jgi:hypothetical protein
MERAKEAGREKGGGDRQRQVREEEEIDQKFNTEK